MAMDVLIDFRHGLVPVAIDSVSVRESALAIGEECKFNQGPVYY